ncbi:MAG: hypothetical protein H6716_24960 [Polyangiaceae bacterium]|nr:hypothetical protein [Polyangiaceae bacterium]
MPGGQTARIRRALRGVASARSPEPGSSRNARFWRTHCSSSRVPSSPGRPASPGPDYDAVSYRLKSRWTQRLQRTQVFIATRRTIAELGGAGGRLPTLGQETHDLHMGSLYLRRLREHPEEAEAWVGEDVFAPKRRGQKLPDAVLLGPGGEPTLAIEFAGSYGPARVARFHEDCLRRGTPYELW